MKIKKHTKSFFLKVSALTCAIALITTGCSNSNNSSTSGSSSDSSLHTPDPNMVLKVRPSTSSVITNGQVDRPWNTISFQSSRMYRNLFQASVGEFDVVPDLAADYTVSGDALVYEITLNDNLLWSDGEAITIDDVVFSIEAILASSIEETIGTIFLTAFSDIVGADDYLRDFSVGLKGVSSEDNKITITLNNPNNLFLQVLSQFVILPKHCFENVELSFVLQYEDYWNNPVCSGMYVQGDVVLGESVNLVYNENYSGDIPYISTIEIREDYELSELSYTETNNISEILDFRSISNQTEYKANSVFYRYFVFDIDNNGVLDPVLSDVRVRKALTLALDRETIVSNVYYGTGTVNNTAAIHRYDSPIDVEYEFNPEKAIELLAEAEYDFDRPIKLLYYYSDDTSYKFMEEVAKCYEDIGLKVELIKGHLYNDDYDMALKGLPVFSINDWYNEYWSTSALHIDIYGGDPIFDEYLISLNKATTLEERSQALIELQEFEYETLYKFPIFVMGHMAYVNDDLTIPSGIEFGDSKYRYDLDFANWKISY